MTEKFTRSGKSNACPVCGRVKDSDCRVSLNTGLIHCHTYASEPKGSEINEYVCHGSSGDGMWSIWAVIQEKKRTRPAKRTQYEYLGRDGKRLVAAVRVDDGEGHKTFYQEHWDGRKYVSGVPENLRQQVTVYRYQQVQAAIAQGRSVFLVEGEGVADRLLQLGLAVTTTLGGSKKYHSYGKYKADLQGAKLVLCPDRDVLGLEHMSEIARDFPDAQWCYCYPDSASWQNLPKNGGLDLLDWIEEGATREDILAAVVDHPKKEQPSSQSEFGALMAKIAKLYEIESEAEQDFCFRKLSRECHLPLISIESIYTKHSAASRRHEPIDVRDLLEETDEPRRWGIPGFIPLGSLIMLHAAGGTGKTVFLYWLVKCMATGFPWAGDLVHKRKVLIIQGDEPRDIAKERMDAAGYSQIDRGLVIFQGKWDMSEKRTLRKWINKFQPDVIIIDSLTRCNASSDSDENDPAYAKPLNFLADLAEEAGIAIIVIHHDNKAGDFRGHSRLKDIPSEVIHLRKGKEGENVGANQTVMDYTKSRSCEKAAFLLDWDSTTNEVKFMGKIEPIQGNRPASTQDRVLGLLKSQPETRFSYEEVSESRLVTPCSQNAARKTLERLCRQGKVLREVQPLPPGVHSGKQWTYLYFCPKLHLESEGDEHQGVCPDGADQFSETLTKQGIQTGQPNWSGVDVTSLETDPKLDPQTGQPPACPVYPTSLESLPHGDLPKLVNPSRTHPPDEKHEDF